MDDTVTVVKHPTIPGAFHFRGYLSEEDFLNLHENACHELEIRVFGDLVLLPVEECSIRFTPANTINDK